MATPIASTKKNWSAAFGAMRKLHADPADTVQVFKIMQALNAGAAARSYERLIATREGGRLAYERLELITRLTDRAWLAQFAAGTVGAAYRAFLDRTGYSADGLKAVGDEVHGDRVEEHPYSWMGRRERDIHDIYHVLTGYQADDPLGELCLVAFTYAQSKGFGWGFIAVMGIIRTLREPYGRAVRRAVREGYARGRDAQWLHYEDIEKLFAEPLDAARARLNIRPAPVYQRIKEMEAAEASATPTAPELRQAA